MVVSFTRMKTVMNQSFTQHHCSKTLLEVKM